MQEKKEKRVTLGGKEISANSKVQKFRAYLHEEYFWVKLKSKKSKDLDILSYT